MVIMSNKEMKNDILNLISLNSVLIEKIGTLEHKVKDLEVTVQLLAKAATYESDSDDDMGVYKEDVIQSEVMIQKLKAMTDDTPCSKRMKC
jgi:uncharacterized protein YqhQ